jgi:hypothetical protein
MPEVIGGLRGNLPGQTGPSWYGFRNSVYPSGILIQRFPHRRFGTVIGTNSYSSALTV